MTFHAHLHRLRWEPYFLIAICMCVLAMGSVIAMDFPPLAGPDEHGHWGFVLHLQQHKALPRFPAEVDTNITRLLLNWEAGQPPLHYLLSALITARSNWEGAGSNPRMWHGLP